MPASTAHHQRLLATILPLVLLLSSKAHTMPTRFTYLSELAPNIQQDMRYAGNNNFIGRPIDGYDASRCILTKRAAKQLAKVQRDAVKRGYSLKVFDCYRPQRAVDDFKAWSKNRDQKMKSAFYPRTRKRKLFSSGYIASYSGHSRGSTVDLTLVQITMPPTQASEDIGPCYYDSRNDGVDSLNMGTSYDCMDKRAHIWNSKVSKQAKKNRKLLRQLMSKHGFRAYSKEWWHFTLKDEPYRRRYFNFPVQ